MLSSFLGVLPILIPHTQSHYVVHADFELLILLPQPPYAGIIACSTMPG
jgi:hypothetical protein